MKKKKRRKLTQHIYHWHYRIGLVLAFFLLILLVTGIALNHNADLNLHHISLDWQWLRDWYGMAEPVGEELPETLTLDRVLLDIHTGQLFGSGGRYLTDLVALLLLWLVVSGIVTWARKVGKW